MANEYFKGKGTMYLRKKNGSGGLLPVGNCSEIALAFSESKQEMKDYELAGGATADTSVSIESVSASVTLLNLNPDNIARVTAGVVSTVTGGAVSSESQTVAEVGAFVKLDKMPDTDIAVVVTGTGGTPVYVDGVDYEVRNGGIVAIAGGGLTAALNIEVSYTALSSRVVETLMEIGEEYEMYFDGLNEARSGKPFLLTAHRAKVNPTQGLPLISDDYASLQFTIDVLRDDTIVGTTKSKYVKMEVAA